MRIDHHDAMVAWTFGERVAEFRDLADAIDELRLTRTGIDLGFRLAWTAGQPMTSSLADIDRDDLRSFVTAWRQLVMKDEPTHLPTLLALCSTHLAHPNLRELAVTLKDRVDLINRNEIGIEERPRAALTRGAATDQREFTPWEIADLIMHGEIFHRRDRAKKKILDDMEASGFRLVADLIFRQYIVDIVEAMDLTRLILLKAKEKAAISDEEVGLPIQPLQPPPSSDIPSR